MPEQQENLSHVSKLDSLKEQYIDTLVQQYMQTRNDLHTLQDSILGDNQGFIASIVRDSGVLSDMIGNIPKNLLDSYFSSGTLTSQLSLRILEKIFSYEQLQHIQKFRKDFKDLQGKIKKSPNNPQWESAIQKLASEYGLQENDLYGAEVDMPTSPLTVDSHDIENHKDQEARDSVLAAIESVKKLNHNRHIRYKMGSRRWGKNGGGYVDCSGLVSGVLDVAGFSVGDQTSRSFFTKLNTRQLSGSSESGDVHIDTDVLAKIRSGDLLYRNSTNPKYQRSTGPIPTVEKDGKTYRIHHIAFVLETFPDGRLRIFESNAKDGVVERIVDPREELRNRSASELYVSFVPYHALPRIRNEIS